MTHEYAIPLDSRLAADTFFLGYLPGSRLLMLKATSLPWLILVPHTDRTEVFELATTEQQQLLENSSALSAFIKQTFKANKINIANIGNIVSQLHIHIVGRYTDDFCWPGVVWGQPDDQAPITSAAEMNLALQSWFGDDFITAETL